MTGTFAEALQALDTAYRTLESALTEAAERPDTAFEAVIALSEPIAAMPRVGAGISRLLEAAALDDRLHAEFRKRAEENITLARGLAELKSTYDAKYPAQDEAAVEAEHARLTAEIASMERRQQLAQELPHVRETAARLKEASSALSDADAEAEEDTLAVALDSWLEPAEALAGALRPKVAETYDRARQLRTELRESLAGLRDTEANLTSLTHKAQDVAERHRAAAEKTERTREDLRLYAKADAELVRAVAAARSDPDTTDVLAALERHRRGLAGIDDALRMHLEARAVRTRSMRLGEEPNQSAGAAL